MFYTSQEVNSEKVSVCFDDTETRSVQILEPCDRPSAELCRDGLNQALQTGGWDEVERGLKYFDCDAETIAKAKAAYERANEPSIEFFLRVRISGKALEKYNKWVKWARETNLQPQPKDDPREDFAEGIKADLLNFFDQVIGEDLVEIKEGVEVELDND